MPKQVVQYVRDFNPQRTNLLVIRTQNRTLSWGYYEKDALSSLYPMQAYATQKPQDTSTTAEDPHFDHKCHNRAHHRPKVLKKPVLVSVVQKKVLHSFVQGEYDRYFTTYVEHKPGRVSPIIQPGATRKTICNSLRHPICCRTFQGTRPQLTSPRGWDFPLNNEVNMENIPRSAIRELPEISIYKGSFPLSIKWWQTVWSMGNIYISGLATTCFLFAATVSRTIKSAKEVRVLQPNRRFFGLPQGGRLYRSAFEV